MRYAYGVAAALLLGGTAFSLATGQAGAQVAQNSPRALAPRRARQCPSPTLPRGFSRRWSTFRPSSASPVRTQTDPFEEFFRRFGGPDGQSPQGPQGPQGGGPGPPHP